MNDSKNEKNEKDEKNVTSFIAPPNTPFLTMERVFNAPRERVFRAYVDPKAIVEWWGPARFITTIEMLEAKVGGRWRFVQRDAKNDKRLFAFHGVFHECTSPSRIVQTFEFEGTPGHVVLSIYTFEDIGGSKTKVTAESVFASQGARDGMVRAGAESGAREGWERLEEWAAKQ